ncbi:MAG TPA: hypothetical protein VD837_05850 [Terriglobales bacterium]|nr:hypothetical protein [Terriglobales bacterium]
MQIEYEVNTDRTSTRYSDADFPGSDYVVSRPYAITGEPADILRLWAVQKPDTPWKRAFDARLDCFTTVLNGCSDFRQLAPSSWADCEAMGKMLRELQRRETTQR